MTTAGRTPAAAKSISAGCWKGAPSKTCGSCRASSMARRCGSTIRASTPGTSSGATRAAADAFQLERLGRVFETVLDCELFHTFDGDERTRYVASLASVTEHDGTLYVLCFSDDGPDTGPHPISQEELRAAFNPSNGWDVAAIEPDRIQTRYHDDGAPAWFATIKRI